MPKSKKPVKSAPDQSAWIEKQRQAIEFVRGGQPSAALQVYEDLERDYPNDSQVMITLINAYYNMGNLSKYESVMRRLVELEGPRADSTYGLGGAYRSSGRRALALRTYRDFLKRWPDDRRAGEVKDTIASLEPELFKQALKMDLSLDLCLDLFMLTDEARYQLDHQNLAQARSVAKRLLRHKQDFIPALDLLVQIDSLDGKLSQALATGQRQLALEPENIQSLNSMVRLNFLKGNLDEARRLAEVLKRAPRTVAGSWTLITEALAFVEDDQGVLDLLADAEKNKKPATAMEDAGFYHLAAVSAWRMGREELARELWEQSLKSASYFSWAKDNLLESSKAPDERGAIWAFPFEYWLLGPLTAQIGEVLKNGPDLNLAKEKLRSFLDETHPELLFLAPHLVVRGDTKSRDFVLRVAALSGHPALVEAAKTLVFAQTGPYAERLQGAQLLVEAGLLPAGPIRLWQAGQWVERLVVPIEVDYTAIENHYSAEASERVIQASHALAELDGAAAQAALEQALALTPDDPLLLNNLGLAYELQDESDKAEAVLKDVYQRFPDNFYAAVGMIRLAIGKDDLPDAKTLLMKLAARPRLHITEFAALCMVEIEACLAEVDRVNAMLWLELWERKDPQNASLADYRKAIEPRTGKKKKKKAP